MNNQQIMSLYEEVAVITDQMVVAARNNDWESLTSLETRCANQINVLKINDQRPPLSEGDRQQKISIIKKILAHDHEIRAITEPRLMQLASLISSSGNERRLNNTYSNSNSG